MTANELRIGNYFQIHGKYHVVYGILGNGVVEIGENKVGYTCEYISPIELTPEILDRIEGFDRCCDGNEYRIGLPLGNGTDLVIETIGE